MMVAGIDEDAQFAGRDKGGHAPGAETFESHGDDRQGSYPLSIK